MIALSFLSTRLSSSPSSRSSHFISPSKIPFPLASLLALKLLLHPAPRILHLLLHRLERSRRLLGDERREDVELDLDLVRLGRCESRGGEEFGESVEGRGEGGRGRGQIARRVEERERERDRRKKGLDRRMGRTVLAPW